jgi:aspartate kinase
VTTLGRGGSDASAVALAAALGAARCDIFTDVPAVFTADPRVVSDARPLATVRPEEMLEMAEAGAAVLQPRAVELAAVHGVEIHLRTSFGAEDGTRVGAAPDAGAELERTAIAGFGHRRDDRLWAAPHASVATVVTALARRGMAIGATVHEQGELRFTVPGAPAVEVEAALGASGVTAELREELGTVGVVCLGLSRRPEVTAGVLEVLDDAGIAPRLVTTSPARVTVHVDADQVDHALRLLHAAFITAAGNDAVEDDAVTEAEEGHAAPGAGLRPDLRVVA